MAGRSRRVRICFPFVGDSLGGSHLSTLLLIGGLADGRYEPIVVVHEDGPLTAHLKARSIPVEMLPLRVYAGERPNAFAIGAGMLRNISPLTGFLRHHAIDIVHANDLRMNLTWSATTRLTGRPFVWHQRTLPYSSSALWHGIELLSDHIIYISEAVSKAIPATRRTPTSIIPNPVGLPQALPSRAAAKCAIAKEFGFDPMTRIIGLVGRIVQWKRPDVFVRSGACLARRAPDLSLAFVIIGHDEEEKIPELRDLAISLGIGEQVYFAGFRHPIEQWILGLDLLTATSEREPFGRTLIEAMALGTPVVASRSLGHIEIIDNERTGVLVPPNDPGAFAAAAHRILNDGEFAAALAAEGRTHALSRYSVERHVRMVTSIYDSLS